MTQTLTIKDVPSEDLAQSIADLNRLGATSVEQVKQDDNNFTLIATFPA